MRSFRILAGLIVAALATLTVACGGGSEAGRCGAPGNPVGLSYDTAQCPANAEFPWNDQAEMPWLDRN